MSPVLILAGLGGALAAEPCPRSLVRRIPEDEVRVVDDDNRLDGFYLVCGHRLGAVLNGDQVLVWDAAGKPLDLLTVVGRDVRGEPSWLKAQRSTLSHEQLGQDGSLDGRVLSERDDVADLQIGYRFGRVRFAKDDRVAISIGLDQGVRPGYRYEVWADSSDAPRRASGQAVIAELTVVDAPQSQPNLAFADVRSLSPTHPVVSSDLVGKIVRFSALPDPPSPADGSVRIVLLRPESTAATDSDEILFALKRHLDSVPPDVLPRAVEYVLDTSLPPDPAGWTVADARALGKRYEATAVVWGTMTRSASRSHALHLRWTNVAESIESTSPRLFAEVSEVPTAHQLGSISDAIVGLSLAASGQNSRAAEALKKWLDASESDLAQAECNASVMDELVRIRASAGQWSQILADVDDWEGTAAARMEANAALASRVRGFVYLKTGNVTGAVDAFKAAEVKASANGRESRHARAYLLLLTPPGDAGAAKFAAAAELVEDALSADDDYVAAFAATVGCGSSIRTPAFRDETLQRCSGWATLLDKSSPDDSASLWNAVAALRLEAGDLDGATRARQSALTRARQAGAHEEAFRATMGLATMDHLQGDHQREFARMESATADAAAIEDPLSRLDAFEQMVDVTQGHLPILGDAIIVELDAAVAQYSLQVEQIAADPVSAVRGASVGVRNAGSGFEVDGRGILAQAALAGEDGRETTSMSAPDYIAAARARAFVIHLSVLDATARCADAEELTVRTFGAQPGASSDVTAVLSWADHLARCSGLGTAESYLQQVVQSGLPNGQRGSALVSALSFWYEQRGWTAAGYRFAVETAEHAEATAPDLAVSGWLAAGNGALAMGDVHASRDAYLRAVRVRGIPSGSGFDILRKSAVVGRLSGEAYDGGPLKEAVRLMRQIRRSCNGSSIYECRPASVEFLAGNMSVRLGRFDAAEQHYRSALAHGGADDARSEDIAFNLSRVLLGRHAPAEAAETLVDLARTGSGAGAEPARMLDWAIQLLDAPDAAALLPDVWTEVRWGSPIWRPDLRLLVADFSSRWPDSDLRYVAYVYLMRAVDAGYPPAGLDVAVAQGVIRKTAPTVSSGVRAWTSTASDVEVAAWLVKRVDSLEPAPRSACEFYCWYASRAEGGSGTDVEACLGQKCATGPAEESKAAPASRTTAPP